MTKRILIIGMSYNLGGIEQIIYDYVSHIKNAEIEFTFTSMHQKIAYQKEYEKMGYKIYTLPDVKKNPIDYALKLMKVIKLEKIDIVHYNMLSAANIVPLIIAKIAGCKRIIAHSHNAGTVGLHKFILHYINRIFIPFFATDLFTCSDEAGHFMFGKNRKTVLIHNAISVRKFLYNYQSRKEIRDMLNIEDDIPIIGHVGRFGEQKNHPFLIEIFHRVAKKHKTAKLLLIGSGHKEQEVRNLVERYSLADNVIFYGMSLEICKLYSAMDIFLFPSLFEGLSMVGTEAQCCGLFVIASDTISKQMEISNLVRWHSLNDSPEKWADTVLECLPKRVTDDMSETIAKAGYDIDIEAKKLERLYLTR